MKINMYNKGMNPKKFGEYLKARREARSLSREEVAAFTNVTAGHIYNIEKGLRIPPPELIIELAKILGTTSGNLITVLEDATDNEKSENPYYFIRLPRYFSKTDYEFIQNTIGFIETTYEPNRRKHGSEWDDDRKEAG